MMMGEGLLDPIETATCGGLGKIEPHDVESAQSVSRPDGKSGARSAVVAARRERAESEPPILFTAYNEKQPYRSLGRVTPAIFRERVEWPGAKF
jgi:hypothetical protein